MDVVTLALLASARLFGCLQPPGGVRAHLFKRCLLLAPRIFVGGS